MSKTTIFPFHHLSFDSMFITLYLKKQRSHLSCSHSVMTSEFSKVFLRVFPCFQASLFEQEVKKVSCFNSSRVLVPHLVNVTLQWSAVQYSVRQSRTLVFEAEKRCYCRAPSKGSEWNFPNPSLRGQGELIIYGFYGFWKWM